jgi:hypothetical protein
MATLAADKIRKFALGDFEDYPVVANDIIYGGAAVGIEAVGGNARPLVAGDAFVGFADSPADNTGGAAAAIRVRTRKRGAIPLPVTGVVATTLPGAAVYASDDDTFTLTASTNSFIGRVSRVVSAGNAIVEYGPLAQDDPAP